MKLFFVSLVFLVSINSFAGSRFDCKVNPTQTNIPAYKTYLVVLPDANGDQYVTLKDANGIQRKLYSQNFVPEYSLFKFWDAGDGYKLDLTLVMPQIATNEVTEPRSFEAIFEYRMEYALREPEIYQAKLNCYKL